VTNHASQWCVMCITRNPISVDTLSHRHLDPTGLDPPAPALSYSRGKSTAATGIVLYRLIQSNACVPVCLDACDVLPVKNSLGRGTCCW
jgi:hypothetical protein